MEQFKPIIYNDPNFQPKKINGLYEYVIHNNEKICGFFGSEGFFLSNGAKCSIYDNLDRSIIYPYSENAYQAAKFLDSDVRKQFANINFATAIKLAWAYRASIRENWSDVKLQEMQRVLEIKFENPILRQKLKNTGEKYLEETNHWKDTFWGVCDGIGENNLGKILMNIRKNLN